MGDHSAPHMQTRVAIRDRTPHRFQVLPLRETKQTLHPLKKTTPMSTARKTLKDVTNTIPRAASKPLPKSASPPVHAVAQLKPPVSVVIHQSSSIRPLNIVKRGTSPLNGLRLPSNTTKVPSSDTTSAVAVPSLPALEFLNDPAKIAPALSRHRRRSRSSNSAFTSKLPTSTARTRINSEQHRSPNFSTFSHLPTPTLGYQRSPRTPSIKSPTPVSEDNPPISQDKISSTKISSAYTSRIPSSKLTAAFQPRTLDPKSRHGVAHSVDIVNLKADFPRARQRPDVRNIFPNDESPEESSKHNEIVAPAVLLRLRSTVKSDTPSKRHAIYTRSLYVGRAEKSPDNYLRALQGTASPPSLRRALTRAIAQECGSDPSGSLDSIVQAYREDVNEMGPQSMGLPTSLSEPTLNDMSSHSLGLACADVVSTEPNVAGTSVSLSSLSSVYSQDSWISGKQQSTQLSNANDASTNEHKVSHIQGHHPIVWELLQKLESAEKAWNWDK